MPDEYLYLLDIIEASQDINEFVDGMSKEQFFGSKLIRWAVIQRLTVIGEAAAKISDDLKAKHSSVIWKEIAGTRNVLVHAYFKIDWEIIWDTIQNDIPTLRLQVLKIVEDDFADRVQRLS